MPAVAVIAVACSGGRDSTALLHATLSAATPLGIEVVALHVHHGLSPNADAWLAHLEAQCRRWARRHPGLRVVAQRLSTRPARGDSVEAWARQARYDALHRMAQAQGATLILLAHHRRDQAETFVLQALRGAGLAGLSAMPASVVRDGIEWHRPWLQQPREAIEAYVRRHRLSHIDDESNDDSRFARNRLRHEVWPALTGAFGDAEAALATSAAWAQEAAAALHELAQIDLQQIEGEGGGGLRVEPWLTLSPARRSNVLRAWLKARLTQSAQPGKAVSATLVERLMHELPTARSARWPLADAELRLHRGVLQCAAVGALLSSGTRPALLREATLSVRRAGRRSLPGWGGSLQVTRVALGGVALTWLAQLDLKPRVGAEQFQSGVDRPPRSLKKQFQSGGVPAWERSGPLLYCGAQLVFVPGLGLDARVIGTPGQALFMLSWKPDQDADQDTDANAR